MSSSRSFTLNLTQTGTGKKATITVTQGGFTPVYTFEAESSSASGTKTIKVTSTKTTVSGGTTAVGWTASVSGSGASLVKAEKSGESVKITVSPNSSYDATTATVTLTQSESGKKITIKVTIAGKADDGVFDANPDALSFAAAGGSKTSKITSTSKGKTVGWTISNNGSIPSWITVSGTGTGTLTVKVTANS